MLSPSCSAFREGTFCHIRMVGIGVTCGQPKGVERGIQSHAYYRVVRLDLAFLSYIFQTILLIDSKESNLCFLSIISEMDLGNLPYCSTSSAYRHVEAKANELFFYGKYC